MDYRDLNGKRVLSLFRTHTYPGYQFCARMRLTGHSADDCLHNAVNKVSEWLHTRIGEEIAIPDLIQSATETKEGAPSYRINEGFLAEAIYLVSEKAWALRLREPDSGNDDRPPVVGRSFVTDVALRCSDNDWLDLGIRINIIEPEGAPEEIAHAFRPGFVRSFFEDPAIEIEQIVPLSTTPCYVETLDELELLHLIIDSTENQLPVVIFTPKFEEYSIEELLEKIDNKAGLAGSESSIVKIFSKLSSERTIEIGDPVYPYDVEKDAGKLFAYGRVYKINRNQYDAFAVLCKKLGLDIFPGDALLIYPYGDIEKPKIFPYEITGGKSAELEKNNTDLLESVKSHSKKASITYHGITFFEDLSDLYKHRRIEELREKTKENKDWFEELVRLDQENKELKETIDSLRSQIYGLSLKTEAKNNVSANGIALNLPNIPEYYEDEVHDLIICIIDAALNNYSTENTRAYELIQGLKQANGLTGKGIKIFKELKNILNRDKNVTERDLAELRDLGFIIAKQANNHYKITFKGDAKHASVLPSTGSDWRGLKNSFTDIMRKISVYKTLNED